jgi:tetratricopeptide (TPR) repeat protein
MHIVFLGNCQLHALQHIFRVFIEPYADCTTDFVDAYGNINASSYERLNRADAVVVQVTADPPKLDHAHIPASAAIHRVPLVSGAFLWPNQGIEHPLKPTARYGNPPYMPEYCDKVLARFLTDALSPQEALARYKAMDVAATAHAGRLYEITLENQRKFDAACGYDCAGIIETHLRNEQLFQSAFHFNTRIARHLGAGLAARMGFDAKIAGRIETHLTESPFVARWVPIHPSIARHFELAWVTEATRYPFLWEGSFTFDDYVLRFMKGRWSGALQEGVIDARAGKEGAREKLQQGLREAPASAEAHHELSKLAEKDGDLPLALSLQRRAVRLKAASPILARLGHLLRVTGEIRQAAAVLDSATQADPMNLGAWAMLRDTLVQMERFRKALEAAEQLVALSPDPRRAEAAVAQIKTKRRTVRS